MDSFPFTFLLITVIGVGLVVGLGVLFLWNVVNDPESRGDSRVKAGIIRTLARQRRHAKRVARRHPDTELAVSARRFADLTRTAARGLRKSDDYWDPSAEAVNTVIRSRQNGTDLELAYRAAAQSLDAATHKAAHKPKWASI